MARLRTITKRPSLSAGNHVRALWVSYRDKKTEGIRNELMERFLPLVKYNAERIHAKLPDEVDIEDLMNFNKLVHLKIPVN